MRNLFVSIWCCPTRVSTPKASAQQVWTSGRHREREAEEVSTTKLIKTHNRHQRRRAEKNMDKRRNGGRKGFDDWEKVPSHTVIYIHTCIHPLSNSVVHFWNLHLGEHLGEKEGVKGGYKSQAEMGDESHLTCLRRMIGLAGGRQDY